MRLLRAVMASVAACVVMAGVTAPAPAWAQYAVKPSPSGGKEEAAVRDVVMRYQAAREARDEKALAALFTEDADQLTSSGEWRRGRDQVVAGGLRSSLSTQGKRTISVHFVRFPAEGVAIADGPYEIVGAAGGEDRKMWTSFVLTRGQDGWRISAIRNMLPAPLGPGPNAPTPPR
jgi:uncharacterized protein (TIGR02246 family)